MPAPPRAVECPIAKPRLGGAEARFLRSVRGGRGSPSEPRQSTEPGSHPNSPTKAHPCDRHHIRSAMAELVSYLSNRTAYAVVRRVHRNTQPRSGGAFFLRLAISCASFAANPELT